MIDGSAQSEPNRATASRRRYQVTRAARALALIRSVADDGDAFHDAHLGPVVRARVVLRRAVVPEGDRVLPPAEAHLVLGMAGLVVENGEQAAALVRLEALDVAGEAAVHV